MKAPERIETARLVLRRPGTGDAEAIFQRYASDPEVTKFLAWPTHLTLEDTRSFLAFSEEEWGRRPAGPYLIESRPGAQLLGGTGLAFESAVAAATGYVLAKDAWGRGYATESLRAMVGLARELGVGRLYARCHPANVASAHVLEKCGFEREVLTAYEEFPNLGGMEECLCFVRDPRHS